VGISRTFGLTVSVEIAPQGSAFGAQCYRAKSGLARRQTALRIAKAAYANRQLCPRGRPTMLTGDAAG